MNLSYWEYKAWLSHIDFTIIGSGIVGLSCALALRKRFPKYKILLLEKGILPQGASTKNAGFACFGSISEIIADLQEQNEEEVVELVRKRWQGIQLLRETIGDAQLDYQNYGGHELFLKEQKQLFEDCMDQLPRINKLLKPVFKSNAFETRANEFNFQNIQRLYISNPKESQIDTGKMMLALLELAQKNGITVMNGITLLGYTQLSGAVQLKTDHFECSTKNLLLATNGFAQELLEVNSIPARAQVLITKPIKNLSIKGSFHMDNGYYYFRNIDNRILLGGGRNLDFEGEKTQQFGLSPIIQNRLESLLSEVILPHTQVDIERRWSGIMGIGDKKRPIVKQLSDRVYCGLRLGGMGIAIGSLVGKELADIVH